MTSKDRKCCGTLFGRTLFLRHCGEQYDPVREANVLQLVAIYSRPSMAGNGG
jgi:hypothetical protein